MVYFCFILWWMKKAFNDHYVLICKTIIWLTTVIPCDICPKTDQFKIIINRELTGSDIFVSSVCRENGWNLHFSFYLSSMSIYQVFFFFWGGFYMESFFDFTFKSSFSKSWTQVLQRFKSCLRCVGDLRRWESRAMVLAENKN